MFVQEEFKVKSLYYEGTKDLRLLEWYNSDGELEAPGDLPSLVEFRPSGHVERLEWHRAGQMHREGDLPAFVRFGSGPDFQVVHAAWYVNGGQHRQGTLPSMIQIDEASGRVCTLMYCRHGEDSGVGDLPYFIGIEPDGTTVDEDGVPINVDLRSHFPKGLPQPPSVEPPAFLSLG